MKVLITGGYGFIGSHVADRFHEEGCEISVIDNLITGSRDYIPFPHKSYPLSVEDPECEEIFLSERFDAVIHLAAQVSVSESVHNPRLDTESNVLGLVHMLHLSQKYKAGKFIFASSAAVYGTNPALPLTESESCDPISPYGISKWTGEIYCRKWTELYGLDTACLRFSNVYGPKQGNAGEGGVVSVFMNRMMEGKPLHIHGDGEQTRDFIYAGDVADAVFRAAGSGLRGIYNLSANAECSVNSLITVLKELHGTVDVRHAEARPGDIRHSLLSNDKISRELNWSPRYGMEEGLKRTYAWFRNRRRSN
ncbi:NAD-dependent epimerase/dehydratase family protein [Paenibacillus sp. N4]|uniref:NAD-dependent epimerase/dehydratase family protein n=1 Tax=Paenibacillus vietnamensis TaxID=2590547 RepID=UPI001CD0879B|nr:NAD-dependent epimerase/dehydratase family protein [Paenibacillus vietnamensis]MCA0756650.1 NAD-dependent epimerase/dehydratase family protein [Paenibacillus vietnamensis]